MTCPSPSGQRLRGCQAVGTRRAPPSSGGGRYPPSGPSRQSLIEGLSEERRALARERAALEAERRIVANHNAALTDQVLVGGGGGRWGLPGHLGSFVPTSLPSLAPIRRPPPPTTTLSSILVRLDIQWLPCILMPPHHPCHHSFSHLPVHPPPKPLRRPSPFPPHRRCGWTLGAQSSTRRGGCSPRRPAPCSSACSAAASDRATGMPPNEKGVGDGSVEGEGCEVPFRGCSGEGGDGRPLSLSPSLHTRFEG